MAPDSTLPLRQPGLSAFLGWIVPGLGHLYQGRIGKGLLFFVCILGLFFAGEAMGNWKGVYFRWDKEEWRWPYLAQLGAGLVAVPALIPEATARRWLPEKWSTFQQPPTEDELDALHRKYSKRIDIALVYTMIAGLLNLLAVYDALAGPALHGDERQRINGGSPAKPEAT